MLIDIDILSIVLLESFGIVSFLLALVFFRQSRKVSAKQESLKKATDDQIWKGPCYSYEWAKSHSMKQKKVRAATPALALIVALWGAVWCYGIGPMVVYPAIIRLGYASIIALIGTAVFVLETNAYEAYGYGKAIQKVALDHLNREDQGYIELAEEALKSATARFVIIGIIFAVVGPFIPQIIDGLVYALAMYAEIFFQMIEVSMKISPLLTFAVLGSTHFLTIILLYILPVRISRTIFRRVKLLTQRIWEQWRKR